MKITFAQRRSHAFALIIVLIVIVVLGILAGGFAYSMKVETRLARQASVETDFEWLGRSGVEAARAVLSKRFVDQATQPIYSLKDYWAGGEGESNDVVNLPPRTIELGSGTATWSIVDAERKFNINTADQALLQRAMMTIGVDAGVSPEIIDSIMDWIDRDDDERLSGAESDFYQRLDPPYEAKNGAIDDITELLLVRGVTPEIFWGTSSTNHDMSAYQQRENHLGLHPREQQLEYPVGLYDLFTAISGRMGVNANTASVETLQAVPGWDTNIAQQVIGLRTGPDGQIVPIKVPEGLGNAMPQPLATQAAKYVSDSSQVFEVTVDCDIAGFHRRYKALLYLMNMREIRILSMYWEPPNRSAVAANSPDPWSESQNY